ncbi:MAG: flavin reductase family protein [Gemmatimonadetes bacterium]|jgi:flavin reductase (DIM6/NTAB) family NADH-FMN oxidoreductase RutF|nr:flavin reductase family protein [Gemmatimonadota bacterium]MBT6144692.1 flavin reductase family protein [Gemmatimonadota bacterium]MBT7861056.1 flavin reductase family protein [Gemmatimonadota bacterium]
MFYRPEDDHGLPRDPFNYLVVPRPIGWISTRSADGVDNLAPYSFFNAVAYSPPQVMFCASSGHRTGGLKDSVANAKETGEFVVNLATWDLREQMNASSTAAPSDIDEFEITGLTKASSEIITPPRVAESPVHLECRTTQTLSLPSEEGDDNTVVFGQVIGIHIDERVLTDGLIDIAKLRPIGRLGALDYVDVKEAFAIDRPTWPE